MPEQEPADMGRKLTQPARGKGAPLQSCRLHMCRRQTVWTERVIRRCSTATTLPLQWTRQRRGSTVRLLPSRGELVLNFRELVHQRQTEVGIGNDRCEVPPPCCSASRNTERGGGYRDRGGYGNKESSRHATTIILCHWPGSPATWPASYTLS
jgi:hypothetical protein